MPRIPKSLRTAIQSGRISTAQLDRLIDLEAQALGLSAREARRRAAAGTLPRHFIADDLALLVQLRSLQPV